MYTQEPEIVNAQDYEGELVGQEIMVDARHQSAWFKQVSEGSDLQITEIFRVKSIEHGWVNFYSDRRLNGKVHTGRFCGSGELFRFNVVEP